MNKIDRILRLVAVILGTILLVICAIPNHNVADAAVVEIFDEDVPLSSGESVVLVLKKVDDSLEDNASETSNETQEEEFGKFDLDNIEGSSVRIPSGTYDFEGDTIYLDKYISITGAGADKTILKNLCIIAPYGISIEGVTMNGGATTSLRSGGGSKIEGTALVVIPTGNNGIKISYKNSTFENADIASFIYGTGNIESDSAEGCTFCDINRVAIFHSINSDSSVYKNNTFNNIGSSSWLNGAVSALWIGDVTNNTYTQSVDLTISGNSFKDIYTADDPDFSEHVINANFIAVRAGKAVIDGNYFSGVHGFGDDREGVYTKVNKLTLTNNTIENCGYGEGYITCKGQGKSDDFAVIKGNRLKGDYGSGIYLYGPGEISNNNIQIEKCPVAIVCHQEANSVSNNTLTVSGNTIKCNPGYYLLNGVNAGNYIPKCAIDLYPSQCDTIVENNKIISDNTGDMWAYAIDVPCTAKNVSIKKNNISIGGNFSIGIFVHASEKFAASNSQVNLDISENTINCGDYGIEIMMKNSSTGGSNRKYVISRNIINRRTTANKSAYVNGGTGNKDSLEYYVATNSKVKVWTNVANVSGDTSYIMK